MSSFAFDHEIVVHAPIEKVFEVWTDFEHWPELYPDTYAAIQVQREGNRVITEETIRTIAGKQNASVETHLEPPSKYTRRFLSGPMEGTERITTLEQTQEGTLVKTRMNVTLGGMAAAFLGDLAETLFQKNIDKLSRAHAKVAEKE